MRSVKVAAVVVTYNRIKLLKECVESLRKQTYKLDAIFIVDNSSTDGAAEWLQTQMDVSTITQENTGGAGGFHTGIKTAFENGFDWIWCMDDDAEPREDALEVLLQHVDIKTQTSALCGKVIDRDGNIIEGHRGKTIFNRINMFHFHDGISPNSYWNDSVINIDVCSFVGILINSNAVEMIGLPKREFFIHLDDIEYSLRLLKYGQIILVPQSVILHKEIMKNIYSLPKKFLWKRSNRVPIQLEWRTYYWKRNFVWIEKEYCHNHIFRFGTICANFLKYVIGITLYDDNKWGRFVLLFNAYLDGLRNNFDNEKPKMLTSKYSNQK